MKKLLIAMFGLSVCLSSPAAAHAESLDSKLYLAVLGQDIPEIESLIKKGAKPNYLENGRPLLGWAAQNGNVQVVEALLKAGANPNVADTGFGHTPLMRAIDTQQTAIAIVLLKAKADPNAKSTDGKSCLLMAAESRVPKIVAALIISGADIKAPSPEGNSPALAAAMDGSKESLEIIRILGKAGANLNESNIIYTPLVYAIQQNNPELVQALLDAGADPNAATKSGNLPLEQAISEPKLLALLLKAKADPNKSVENGDTALISAIRNSNVEAVKALLAAGADTAKVDQYGKTPLEIAEQNYQTEIAALLRPKGAAEPATPDAPFAGAPIPIESKNGGCTVVDAAKKQMELHGKLQDQVALGKMSSDIFRTFNDDTKDYARMLAEDPDAACKLFERLEVKYLGNK